MIACSAVAREEVARPLGTALAQIGLYTARMVIDLVSNERVELGPPRREHFGAQVLTPRHWRRLQNVKREVTLGWRGNGRGRAAFSVCRPLTKAGQIQAGEVARIDETRRQAGLKLGRREVEKTTGRAVGESRIDSFPGRTVQRGTIRSGDLTNVEMALWRQNEFKRHERLGIPTHKRVPRALAER